MIFLIVFAALFYSPLILEKKLPIPADTIVGLYHPWRDYFSKNYPNGIPFKNFQITDSVRQQYPWRSLSIDLIKRGEVPRSNPYSFSGTPLLGNFQSAVFYPLNILSLLVSDFASVWAIQVVLQTVLGGIFMWAYLHNLKLKPQAQVLGTLAWVGSGFFIAWLEWNTVVHVAIYLPLVLLTIDEIILEKHSPPKSIFWPFVFVGALVSSFFAGYLQPFFYVFITSLVYLSARVWQTKKFQKLLLFSILYVLFFIISLPQLIPTLSFINLSARDVDQANWTRPDWFLPWQNLIQLVAPDFFGNPATLNYFGVWNYQEFVSFIGTAPLVFALAALFMRRDKKTLFWGALLTLTLVFALPTPIARLPYVLKLPFLSTAQPSRIIMLVDFALAILAALGLDHYLRKSPRAPLGSTLIVVSALALLLIFTYKSGLLVSQRNLILPLVITVVVFFLLSVVHLVKKTKSVIVLAILILTLFDLLRFATKFEPFSPREYLYPSTKILSFLEGKAKEEVFRVAALDDRILPSNFNVAYKIQMAAGYDPLYSKRYGQFIASLERGKPDISPPWGFNRIITPKLVGSHLYGLLNTKYVLSFVDFPQFKLLAKEGDTYLFEYPDALPRAFFVSRTINAISGNEAISKIYSSDFDSRNSAVVENFRTAAFTTGQAKITSYTENTVVLQTQNTSEGFLVLLDAYYPDWHATVDSVPTQIYITNYIFRGIKVPRGNHLVKFQI